MNPERLGKWICTRCGAINPARAGTCWICGAPAAETAKPAGGEDDWVLHETDVPAGLAKGAPRPTFQFHLTGLLLLTALVALALGMYRQAPGLVVLLAIVAGPALLATFGRSMIRRSKGRPLTGGETMGTFLVSLGITMAIFIGLAVIACVAVVVALAIICSNGSFLH